jgi:transcriptional regulator with XRE-family HTH domain
MGEELSPSIAQHLERLVANIRACRLRSGLTQEQLADAAQIELRLLERIERGATNFDVYALVALASALGVRPDELLGAEPTTTGA